MVEQVTIFPERKLDKRPQTRQPLWEAQGPAGCSSTVREAWSPVVGASTLLDTKLDAGCIEEGKRNALIFPLLPPQSPR